MLTAPGHTETPRGYRIAAKVLPAVFLESSLSETSDFRVVFQELAVSSPPPHIHIEYCLWGDLRISKPAYPAGFLALFALGQVRMTSDFFFATG